MEHQAIWRHGISHRDAMMDGRKVVENDKRESENLGLKAIFALRWKSCFNLFTAVGIETTSVDEKKVKKMRIWSWRKRKEK